MRIVHSELINDIIKTILPQSVLQQKPVIAGGSILSLYLQVVNDHLSNNLKANFGDIDCWFLKDNPIHNSFEYSFLFEDVNSSHGDAYNYNEKIERYGWPDRLIKSSRWANTFLFSPGFSRKKSYMEISVDFEYQIVKTKPESIEQLLQGFDINIVSIAWHDGNIYISERADAALKEDGEIEIDRTIIGGRSVIQKVYSVIRAFKHSRRNSKQFSKQTTEDVFDIFLDYTSLYDKCFGLKVVEEKVEPSHLFGGVLSSSKVTKKVVVDIESPDYDEVAGSDSGSQVSPVHDSLSNYAIDNKVDIDFIVGLYNSLSDGFKELISMKYFDKTKLLYFVSSADPFIRNSARAKVDPENSNVTSFDSDIHIPF